MAPKYFFVAIVAVIILYVNTITILKKVKKEEDTCRNTWIGSICLIVIFSSIYLIYVG